jgi:hypothetical protein
MPLTKLDTALPRERSDERHLPFAERLQLSDVGCRGDRVQCGNMDALGALLYECFEIGCLR